MMATLQERTSTAHCSEYGFAALAFASHYHHQLGPKVGTTPRVKETQSDLPAAVNSVTQILRELHDAMLLNFLLANQVV